ncbi:Subtilisin-like protease SBT1.7 [Linum perenne]
MIYTYNYAIHGYSARLTSAQAKLLQSQPGIFSVIPETRYELHTTHTPQFLGLDLAAELFPQADTVGEVVVGVLDTGVWPESKSFDDTGFGPLPGTWNGECEVGTNFTRSNCNRKLIGARSPRDDDGHGTHTSTTAAGSAVDGASLLGYASGTARGMASRARVAVYKVCWIGGCFSSDILAAMDKAIEDGVNGVSLYKGVSLPTNLLPFVYAGNASNATNGNLCMMGTLIPDKVKGKIVLCDRGVNSRVQKGAAVKAAGGFGMVLTNTEANGEELVADAHLLPATAVGEKTGDAIKKYLTSDPSPKATILFQGTKLGIEPSPVVAAFSSRGPNSITPEILKPDVIAPGVNILAGWSVATDPRRVEFNVISGTSMSCPHVSGLAALLKAAHPEWSPAAVRSALMTTAYSTYKNGQKFQDVATGNDSTPFDHGAGHVNPVAALNPGLVYDLTADDYLGFLCALNYTDMQIKSVARKNYTCDHRKKYRVANLNYPSFAVNVDATQMTLTNVEVGPTGEYTVSISPEQIPGVEIQVQPKTLSFKNAYEKKTYTVTFIADLMPMSTNSFARLVWTNGKRTVGSPVAVSWT